MNDLVAETLEHLASGPRTYTVSWRAESPFVEKV